MTDFHSEEFAQILAGLEPHLPISDAFELALPQEHGSWWSSQQQHMVSWFQAQNTTGAGAYTRQVPNISARRTYNRLLAPAAFIWMAEALGEDATVVQDAADAARAEPSARRRPGLIRKKLPWERIAQLAETKRHITG